LEERESNRRMSEGEKWAINFVACMNRCTQSKIRGVFFFSWYSDN
jgi:hypothetical protein